MHTPWAVVVMMFVVIVAGGRGGRGVAVEAVVLAESEAPASSKEDHTCSVSA